MGLISFLAPKANDRRMHMKGTLRLCVAAMWFSVFACLAFGQAQDVSGRWEAKLERGGRSMRSTLDLKVSGNQVTGTIDLAPEVTVQIRNGKFEGSQLTFDVTAPEHGGTKEIHFVGDVQDEVITLRNESRSRPGRTAIFQRSKV